MKNQVFIKFMAWLMWKRFNSTEVSHFRQGHRRGCIDQDFSVIGTALNKKVVLQTPDDFQQTMQGARGRSGQRPVRVVPIGALDYWEAFFAPLSVSPHSHVQTRNMKLQHKEAYHVLRFFWRDRLHCIPGGLDEGGPPHTHTVFADPPAADDSILITKHFLGSTSYAQEPEVLCPGARFRELPARGSGVISGRTQLSARQRKEFLRTAREVEESPWNMETQQCGSATSFKQILKASQSLGCHPRTPG